MGVTSIPFGRRARDKKGVGSHCLPTQARPGPAIRHPQQTPRPQAHYPHGTKNVHGTILRHAWGADCPVSRWLIPTSFIDLDWRLDTTREQEKGTGYFADAFNGRAIKRHSILQRSLLVLVIALGLLF